MLSCSGGWPGQRKVENEGGAGDGALRVMPVWESYEKLGGNNEKTRVRSEDSAYPWHTHLASRTLATRRAAARRYGDTSREVTSEKNRMNDGHKKCPSYTSERVDRSCPPYATFRFVLNSARF